MDKNEFLDKYGIKKTMFKKSKLEWDSLLEIKNDYEKNIKSKNYEEIGKIIATSILSCNSVHSVKFRIKDSEHLIEKIVRKTLEDPKFQCTTKDYFRKIAV